MRYICGTLTRLRRLIGDRRGAVAMIFALSLVPLIGFTGVAIDYARLAHMQTTLQAAADAAAVSGAAANFGTSAQETAANNADGPHAMATNFLTNAWLPLNNGVTPTVTAPAATSTNGATVTVTATAQVAMSFLAIWRSQIPVSVTATATVSVPTSATGTFPFVLPSCLLTDTTLTGNGSTYWNAATGEPNIDPSTGKPYEITMDSAYHGTNDCTNGQWTSFLTDSNSTATIAGDMTSGCGCTLSVGDSVYIEPGTKAALYGDAASFDGQTVLVAVVGQNDLTKAAAKTDIPVVGFAAFVIDSTDQGGKTITGHFTSNYQGGGLSGTGGTYYGVDTVSLSQ